MRGIVVRNSEKGGRGVFATKAFRPGDTIEVCPLIIGRLGDRGASTADYVFGIDDDHAALPMGYGSLYNHGVVPNAKYEHTAKHAFKFSAIRPIAVGEEILSSYGLEWWKARGKAPN